MTKATKHIRFALKCGTLLGTLCFLVSTLVQIYARFFMEKAPSWTEEGARLFFVFAIGCASGLAMRGNYYVHFDFLFAKFNTLWQRRIRLLIYATLVVLFAIFSVQSFEFLALGWDERSPSLKFPMSIAFLGITAMGLSITFFAATSFFKLLKKR